MESKNNFSMMFERRKKLNERENLLKGEEKRKLNFVYKIFNLHDNASHESRHFGKCICEMKQ